MALQLNVPELEELMSSLYMLSGIKFALFDTEFRELLAYPAEGCDFCRMMKSCSATRRKCSYADRRSFKECEKQNSLIVYKCHAGLVEAVAPLFENERIIGYLMFGQISDNPDKSNLYEKQKLWQERYGMNADMLARSIDGIPVKTKEQIQAAVRLMEACTSYIIFKELITPEKDKIFEAAKAYIEENLGEDISIEVLCKEINVGRTRLYEIFRNEAKMGISKYILHRRLHRAKKLLKTTELTVSEIARQVGFSDYNYFSRLYKKRYGKSPRHYRKK